MDTSRLVSAALACYRRAGLRVAGGQRRQPGRSGALPSSGDGRHARRASSPPGERAWPMLSGRWRRRVAEGAVLLATALLLSYGIRAYVVQIYWIPTSSMEPTLGIGDRILVEKAFFNWRDVRSGDVVVFSRPPRYTGCASPPGPYLVKRVIALPGQTIYSVGSALFVDGRALAEPYLPKVDPLGRPVPGSSEKPFRVPPGEFYVMGDNRAISCDSRYWGPIAGASIVGKAVLLLWHDGQPCFHLFGPN